MEPSPFTTHFPSSSSNQTHDITPSLHHNSIFLHNQSPLFTCTASSLPSPPTASALYSPSTPPFFHDSPVKTQFHSVPQRPARRTLSKPILQQEIPKKSLIIFIFQVIFAPVTCSSSSDFVYLLPPLFIVVLRSCQDIDSIHLFRRVPTFQATRMEYPFVPRQRHYT